MKCYDCGFWDSDREGCTCPSVDMWYVCPIESAKPRNQKALKDYAKWMMEQRRNNDADLRKD